MYVIAWEEYGWSQWLQQVTGIPILTASTGLSILAFRRTLLTQWQKQLKHSARQLLTSPVKLGETSGNPTLDSFDRDGGVLCTRRKLHFDEVVSFPGHLLLVWL